MAPPLHSSDRSTRSENEDIFQKFYLECRDPVTASEVYKFEKYSVDMAVTYSEAGGYGVYVKQRVTDPGQMLMVEIAQISWASLGCSPHTEDPSASAPGSARIPQKAHKQLVKKFHERFRGLMKAVDDRASPEDDNAEVLNIARYLDARPYQSAILAPLEERGPWKKYGTGLVTPMDPQRVANIIRNNAICCVEVRSKICREDPGSQVKTPEFWGLWLTTSFINHSCVPNCHAMRVGKAMIIRAAKAIEVGEELTLPYFDIFQPLHKREMAALRWGFRCECRRCEVERLLGQPYKDIQTQILNLEEKLQESLASTDSEQVRRKKVQNQLTKLRHQGTNEGVTLLRKIKLKSKYPQMKAGMKGSKMIPCIKMDDVKLCEDCIPASFSEGWIAHCVLSYQERYKEVTKLLRILTKVHPGNLLCEDLYATLILTRNDLNDETLDGGQKEELGSRESYVRMANEACSSYYGPTVQVFDSTNPGDFRYSPCQTERMTKYNQLWQDLTFEGTGKNPGTPSNPGLAIKFQQMLKKNYLMCIGVTLCIVIVIAIL